MRIEAQTPHRVTAAAGAALVLLALYLLAAGRGGDQIPAPAGGSLPVADNSASEVVSFWEARVREDPAGFTAQNKLALAYMQRAREKGDVADYARAEAAVSTSITSLPGDNPTAYATLASLQVVKHDFLAALETAGKALTLDPGSDFALSVLGDAQVSLGQYERAYATYQRLVVESPSLSSFSRLAYIHELRGETRDAEIAWQNALSTDGGQSAEATAFALTGLGNFQFSRGNLAGAREQYERALGAFPGYVHGQAALARVSAAEGDLDAAIDLYRAATARQPLPEYVAALGDAYRAAGRETEAQTQFGLVEAISALYKANGINTDLTMAMFFADHDIRLEDAVAQARAVRETQNSIQASDTLAWALYKSGRYTQAERYAAEALRLNTPDASFLYHAGMIQKALGNSTAAVSYLEQALDINPRFSIIGSAAANQALAELEAR